MSSGAEYLGLLRVGAKGQSLLASVFLPKTATLDKSQIERHFIEVSSKETSQKSGFKTSSNVGKYQCYIQYDEALSCCIATAAPLDFSERLAWDLLLAAKEEVHKLAPDEVANSQALGLNKSLRDTFRILMNGGKSDKLADAQTKVDAAKVQMADNMGKVAANVQNIEDLEARAADLQDDSQKYQNNARDLKKHARWEHMKWILIFGSILLVSILLFLWLGGAFSSGSSSSNN
eukprot:GEMP01007482.1.p1 GENE.GEMP01007482.1~~GEMP01007482.1.p1  ORF type:complete len:233 (+),score=50.46 GEMP01007482.1:93-791(+)